MIGHVAGLLATDGEEMRAEKERDREKRGEKRMAGIQAEHVRLEKTFAYVCK